MVTVIITKIALTLVVVFLVCVLSEHIFWPKRVSPYYLRLTGGLSVLGAISLGVVLAFIGIWS